MCFFFILFIESASNLVEGLYGHSSAKLIYGVFNTPTNSIPGSAVCAFSLQVSSTFIAVVYISLTLLSTPPSFPLGPFRRLATRYPFPLQYSQTHTAKNWNYFSPISWWTDCPVGYKQTLYLSVFLTAVKLYFSVCRRRAKGKKDQGLLEWTGLEAGKPRLPLNLLNQFLCVFVSSFFCSSVEYCGYIWGQFQRTKWSQL